MAAREQGNKRFVCDKESIVKLPTTVLAKYKIQGHEGPKNTILTSQISVQILTLRLLMSYIYGAPILDVSRSHTTTQHSR